MNKPAEKEAPKAAAPPPETEKERLRRIEDEQDALLDLLPASDAGMAFPEIQAAAVGFDGLHLQETLDALCSQGRASMVIQDSARVLAYRRTT